MKKIICLIAIISFVFSTINAQHPHKPKHSKAHKAALKQHFNTAMYPTLQAEQQVFDNKLTADDLAFLQAKRAEAAALRVERHNLGKEIKALRKKGVSKEDIRAQFSQEQKQLKTLHSNLHQSMQSFIQKNEASILESTNTLAPLHKQWKAERKAIHQQFRDNATAKKPKKQQKPGEANSKKERATLRFLLWDGQPKKVK